MGRGPGSDRVNARAGEAAEMLGECPAMREVLSLIARVAPTSAPVLLLGESGTGKEMAARAIHRQSPRASGPFLVLDCASVPEGLLDSELFGHARGAFTGASTAGRGLLRAAGGGTLLLDHVASTSAGFQARLLRLLDGGEVRPVGSTASFRPDARIVAASSRDLRQAVQAGELREDLYYRLNVVSIALPPLRERGRDVELLARYFLARAAGERGVTAPLPSAGYLARLRHHRWPGNVRELRHAIEQSLVACRGDRLDAGHLPGEVAGPSPAPGRMQSYASAKREALDGFTRRYLADLLRASDGNVSRAARMARIPRQTLHRLLRRYRDG